MSTCLHRWVMDEWMMRIKLTKYENPVNKMCVIIWQNGNASDMVVALHISCLSCTREVRNHVQLFGPHQHNPADSNRQEAGTVVSRGEKVKHVQTLIRTSCAVWKLVLLVTTQLHWGTGRLIICTFRLQLFREGGSVKTNWQPSSYSSLNPLITFRLLPPHLTFSCYILVSLPPWSANKRYTC